MDPLSECIVIVEDSHGSSLNPIFLFIPFVYPSLSHYYIINNSAASHDRLDGKPLPLFHNWLFKFKELDMCVCARANVQVVHIHQ